MYGFHESCWRNDLLKSTMEVVMTRLMALMLVLMIGALAGCNTMQGLGKDIERGGETLQGSAKNAQEKM